MKIENLYFEHKGKFLKTDKRFKHVMAMVLDPSSGLQKGIIRCITERIGDITMKGYSDRSELYKIEKNKKGKFEIKDRLRIINENKIIKKLTPNGRLFIGLEDPDIWLDEKSNLIHVYFYLKIKNI